MLCAKHEAIAHPSKGRRLVRPPQPVARLDETIAEKVSLQGHAFLEAVTHRGCAGVGEHWWGDELAQNGS